MAEIEQFDVIVVGGGPSGSSAAIFNSKSGKKVLLLDRAKFPRDKTCGDGISGRSVRILDEMGVLEEVKKFEHMDMSGVTFSSPAGAVVPISANKPGQKKKTSPGFVCRREVFDNILFQKAKSLCTKTIEGFLVLDLLMNDSKVVGVKGRLGATDMEFGARVVVCADGAGSVLSRKVGAYNNDEEHQCAGVRCYYEGVDGMTDQIELHFIKNVLPGYFWIFPLPNKKANIGIGMPISDMKKNKVNLQKVMFDVIGNNELFKDRFKNAKRSSDVKSWLLPLGSKRMKLSGDGYLLVGDAASLIDPFTGEGIGNALTSGKYAADAIDHAFKIKDFSETTLECYEESLFADIGEELKNDYDLQRLSKHGWLFNFIINRAKNSNYVRDKISDALLNAGEHKTLKDPLFIIKAIFM